MSNSKVIVTVKEQPKGLVLDPYMVQAVADVTATQLADAFLRVYPEYVGNELITVDYVTGFAEKWLAKLGKRPSLALSTGRRNSFKGEMTCALLELLGVTRPKAERVRMDLAWEILNSQVGRAKVGYVPELEAEREMARKRGYGQLR